MLKIKFQANQYLINKKLANLEKDVDNLLKDILQNINQNELSKLEGYYLEDVEMTNTIKSINTEDYTMVVYDYDNQINTLNISELPLFIKRDLINFIINNDLKMKNYEQL